MRKKMICMIFAVLFLWANVNIYAVDKNPCQVHVILFVPADIKTPSGYQSRIDQIISYTETFFEKELKRWNHANFVMPFKKSADGHIPVTIIKGKLNSENYKPVAIRMEVMDQLRSQNKITKERQIWWILVGTDPKNESTSEFLGGYGNEIGGWAVCDLSMAGGIINNKDELGSDLLEKIKLKGMIHELGHAFKLPHIGPHKADKAGNTLMGPTHYNFRRVVTTPEDRVYLSEAEAAIFSLNPAFQGKVDNGGPLPKVNVQNLTYSVNTQKQTFVVSGKIISNVEPVYAIVADESDERPGEYWTKTYVSKINKNMEFTVNITELPHSNGSLKTWFIFHNGEHTGNGKTRSKESAITKPYTYSDNKWIFE